MKYLKKYKVFESESETKTEEVMDLEDILLELNEEGFFTKIYHSTPNDYINHIHNDYVRNSLSKKHGINELITIRIAGIVGKQGAGDINQFQENIKEVFGRCEDYIKSSGFNKVFNNSDNNFVKAHVSRVYKDNRGQDLWRGYMKAENFPIYLQSQNNRSWPSGKTITPRSDVQVYMKEVVYSRNKVNESWESNFDWEDDFYDYRDTEKPKVEIPESLEERCKKFIDGENKKGIEKGDLTYTINGDVVNVDGYFSLKLDGLDEIPIKFGEVKGSMFIDGDILTLKNAPEKVSTLNIRGCRKLKSLEGGPTYVKNWYHIPDNIESLEGLARPVNTNIGFTGNSYKLSFPKYGGNKLTDVLQMFIYRNQDNEFEITDEVYEDIELFNDYDPLQGDKLILDRMNEFLEARVPEGHPLEDHMGLEDDKIEWLKKQGIKIV